MAQRLKVLVGERPSREIREICSRNGWGEMYIYSKPRNNFAKSGFDNGAWLDFINGRSFDERRYQRALDRAATIGKPYFAVVPDLVACGLQSLTFSLSWLDRMPPGWRCYLAVQDGMKCEHIEPF